MAYKRKGGSKKRVDEMTRDIKRVYYGQRSTWHERRLREGR